VERSSIGQDSGFSIRQGEFNSPTLYQVDDMEKEAIMGNVRLDDIRDTYERARKVDGNEMDVEYIEGVISALGWILGEADNPLSDYDDM
jgi:hypothetical protein